MQIIQSCHFFINEATNQALNIKYFLEQSIQEIAVNQCKIKLLSLNFHDFIFQLFLKLLQATLV